MQSSFGGRGVDPAFVLGPLIVLLLLAGGLMLDREDDPDVALSETADSDLMSLPAVSATDTAEPTAGSSTRPSEATGTPTPPADGVPSAPVPSTPPSPASASPTAPPAAPPGADIVAGTCFDGSVESVEEIQPVDCAGPHGNEVYIVLDAPGDAAAPYPGEDQLLDSTAEICRGQAFSDYVGVDWADSRFFTSPVVPTERSWQQGDRTVACFLYDLQGPWTGSAQGSQM